MRYYIEVRVLEVQKGQKHEEAKVISSSSAAMPTEVRELAEAWAVPLNHALSGVQRMAESLNR